MVQTALIYLFGFFCAGFIAFAVAPLIWRRAAQLTQLRIEASTPLTLNEVQADKDQQRAEFAMALRKIEIKSKQVNEERIVHMADAATSRELVRVKSLEYDTLAATAQVQAENLLALEGTVLEAKQDVEFLVAVRDELEKRSADLERQLAVRTKVISELQVDADNKRIEYVARVTEREQIKGRVSQLVQSRKALEDKLRESTSEVRALRETARTYAKKMLDIERKSERLLGQLSDREEKLERRDKEIVRLKEAAKSNLQQAGLLKLSEEITGQINGATTYTVAKPPAHKIKAIDALGVEVGKLKNDKTRLLGIMSQMNDEKDALVQKLQAASSTRGIANDARLREQMRDLTAKVVSFTAETEGFGSPISKIVQKPQPTKSAGQMLDWPEGKVPESLAERIMALQKPAQRG